MSCTTTNNGIAGFYDIEHDFIESDAITIAANGAPLASFYHPYEFAAKDDVLVAKMAKGTPLATKLYIVAALNRLRWRFSYGRKCYQNKLPEVRVQVPVLGDGSLDHAAMAAMWSQVGIGDRVIDELGSGPRIEPFVASADAVVEPTEEAAA